MSTIETFKRPIHFKYADSVLSFAIDWQDYLDNENISVPEFTWEVPDDLILVSHTSYEVEGRMLAIAWIGGGQENKKYTATCKIANTNGPLIDERNIDIWIKER